MVALTIVFGAVDSPKASVGASRERLAFTHTPTDRSRAPSASFAWTETLGAHYECSLDDGARRACSSPTGLLFVAAGRHTFVVSDGSAEIRFAWTVVGGAPATLTSRMQFLRLAPAGMVLGGRPGRAPGGPWYSVRQLPGHDAVAVGLDEKDDAVGFAHDGNYNYRGVVWRKMTVRVTVQIDRPAPPGGVTVVLRRGSPGIDIPSLPSRLVIPAGSSSRTISLQLPSVRVRTNARIAASLYCSTAQATIVLLQHAA